MTANLFIHDKTVEAVIALNKQWRVQLENTSQWILERRRGRSTAKRTGWVARSFCATRRALIRNIKEDCGEVDPDALRQVEALPEKFPYRTAGVLQNK